MTEGYELVKALIPRDREGEREARSRLAAKMRAEHKSWAVIAKKLGYKNAVSAGSSVKITPELWRQYMREALDDLHLDVLEPETIENTRKLMHLQNDSEDPKVAQVRVAASDAALRFLAKIRPQQIDLNVRHLEQTDEELIARIAETVNAGARRIAGEGAIVVDAEVISVKEVEDAEEADSQGA